MLTETFLVFLPLVQFIPNPVSGQLCNPSTDCYVNNSATIEPNEGQLYLGQTVKVSFQTKMLLGERLELTFQSGYCSIPTSSWGSSVDFNPTDGISDGRKCVTQNRTLQGTTTYTVSLPNIQHAESGLLETDRLVFGSATGPKLTWVLVVSVEAASVKFEIEELIPGEFTPAPFDKGELSVTAPLVISCLARQVRPLPQFRWIITDYSGMEQWSRDYNVTGITSVTLPDEKGEGFNAWQDFNYTPDLADDGKILWCYIIHMNEINMEEANNTRTWTRFSIQGPPVSKNSTVSSGCDGECLVGEKVTLLAPFHANPWNQDLEPGILIWNILGLSLSNESNSAGRFTARGWRPQNGDWNNTNNEYFAILDIDPLEADDSTYDLYLTVENSFGATNYTVRIGAIVDSGLSAGAIAGIVVGVVAVVGIMAGTAVFIVRKKKAKKAKAKKEEKRRRRAEAAAREGYQESEQATAPPQYGD